MVNKTVIQGRLTRTPELRYTNAGTPVTSFTVAWSEKYGDKERKLFLPCVAWKHTAEFAAKYFDKGSELVAEGRLTSRKWQDNNGNNRETVELVVDELHFCGSKRAGGNAEEYTEASPEVSFVEIADDSDFPF